MKKQNLATDNPCSLPINAVSLIHTIVLRDLHTQSIFDFKAKIRQMKIPPQEVVIVLAKICDENKGFLCDGDIDGVLQRDLTNESTVTRPMTRKSTLEFLKTFDVTAAKKMEDHPDELLVVITIGKIANVYVA